MTIRYYVLVLLLCLLVGVTATSAQDSADSFLEAGDEEDWRFDVSAGQIIIVTMERTRHPIDPMLRMYDTDGRLLVESDDSPTPDAIIGPFQAPADDTYTIIASNRSEDEAGNYRLTLYYLDPLPAEPLLMPSAESSAEFHQRGLIALERGQKSQAMADFNRAIELDAAFAPAYRDRSRVYLALNDWDRAQVDAATAVELEPDDALNYVQLADVYQDRGQIHLAQANLDHARELAPDLPEINFVMARRLAREMRFIEVQELLSGQIAADPTLQAYRVRAEIYALLGDPDLRRDDLIQQILLAPSNPAVYVAWGDYHRMSNDEQARHNYDLALQLDPTYADAFYGIARTYIEENEREVIALMQQALEHGYMRPDLAYYEIAEAYKRRGRLEEAAEAYDLSLAENPYLRDARIARGRLHLNETGDYAAAVADFDAALTAPIEDDFDRIRTPPVGFDLEIWLDRGDAYRLLGNDRLARADYRRVLDSHIAQNTGMEAAIRLGDLSFDLDDMFHARLYYLIADEVASRTILDPESDQPAQVEAMWDRLDLLGVCAIVARYGDQPLYTAPSADATSGEVLEDIQSVQMPSLVTGIGDPEGWQSNHAVSFGWILERSAMAWASVETDDGSTWYQLTTGLWVPAEGVDAVDRGGGCENLRERPLPQFANES